MSPLILLELNEVNFEFVEHYCRRGELPSFARLIAAQGCARTASETAYEQIKPWIQWVTVHTGKSYDEPRVFRLGEGARAGIEQIWKQLEKKGLRVGAFSPMNAANAAAQPAFFVPDPWTQTSVTAPLLLLTGLADCLALEPRPRVMIATGLHQDPVDEPVFYWRLRDHAAFLGRIGCRFAAVEPLMSRDSLVRCMDATQAAAAAARLASGRAPDGLPLFEVDNRGASLFVTLSYPREVKPGFAASFEGARAAPGQAPIPLADLRHRIVAAF